MNYIHIHTGGSTNFGTMFGQNLEPKGEYMNFMEEGSPINPNINATYGVITFSKPLIMEWKSTGENGWKKDLSEMFGGKTGKALSNAIKKAGYDAVVTYEEFKGQRVWSEIVNLNGSKK